MPSLVFYFVLPLNVWQAVSPLFFSQLPAVWQSLRGRHPDGHSLVLGGVNPWEKFTSRFMIQERDVYFLLSSATDYTPAKDLPYIPIFSFLTGHLANVLPGLSQTHLHFTAIEHVWKFWWGRKISTPRKKKTTHFCLFFLSDFGTKLSLSKYSIQTCGTLMGKKMGRIVVCTLKNQKADRKGIPCRYLPWETHMKASAWWNTEQRQGSSLLEWIILRSTIPEASHCPI